MLGEVRVCVFWYWKFYSIANCCFCCLDTIIFFRSTRAKCKIRLLAFNPSSLSPPSSVHLPAHPVTWQRQEENWKSMKTFQIFSQDNLLRASDFRMRFTVRTRPRRKKNAQTFQREHRNGNCTGAEFHSVWLYRWNIELGTYNPQKRKSTVVVIDILRL